MMNKLKNLLSRKFLISVIATIGGVMGMLNYSENTIAFVVSVATALIPTVIYVVTEGKLDAIALQNAITAVTEAVATGAESTAEQEEDGGQ